MADEKTILVIDDEVAIVNVIRLHLEKKGYKVFAAHDGEEGLERARQLKPGLIILDINMPKKNGLEFYKDIIVDNKKTLFPVLVLTGRREFEGFFKDIEADGFVPKPIDFGKLVEEVDRIFLKYKKKEEAKKTAKNVLIVEDSDEILDRMVVTFIRAGLTLHCIKTAEDLAGQMPAEPVDLILTKLSLCDVIPELRKVPQLMRENTKVLLYTAENSLLDDLIVKKLCEKPGIAPAELILNDKAPELLKKAQEILRG